MGRPKGDTPPKAVLTLRADPDLIEWLDQEASARGRTRSAQALQILTTVREQHRRRSAAPKG